MPDPEVLIESLDAARNGLNTARNAVGQWQQGVVAGVAFTAAQLAALRAQFDAGIQAGKDGIVAVDLELLN